MAATVRIFQADEWITYRRIRLEALLDAPDSFGSTWAAESVKSDEQWAARLHHGVSSGRDLPQIAEVAAQPAGLAWAIIADADATLVNLYQMWVVPHQRNKGVGQMLLSNSIAWARGKGCRNMVLGVARGAEAAVHLYTRTGFVPIGSPSPLRQGSDLEALTLQLTL